ncbi:hypothetical protein HDU86_000935 [Geranomyces michiganensis]|nr:hypothetical protein HDU86_000935 [Geranomyces michiganensis]
MAGLPLAFISVSDVVYGSTMYFMLPAAVVAVFTAGIPGMSAAIAMGFTSVAFVSVRYRQAHENSNVDAVLHLQLWTIALIGATLLLTVALRELHVCQHALDNLKRGINRSATRSEKHASLCVAGESPYILRYVCMQLEKPLREILQDCRLMTADACGKSPSLKPELAQVSVEVAGRTINRIAEYMLPVIADAGRLASIVEGRDKQVLTSVDLPVFLEGLSAQLREELADSDIKTRFDLPNTLIANVDEERISRILRAMVTAACRRKTREGHVCIQASASSRNTHSIKCDDYFDLDITVTVTGWVLERHDINLLVRPYMPRTDLSTRDVDHSGTDLGLAVASHLARFMKGRLVVFGQHGNGTILDCKLPVIIGNTGTTGFFHTLKKKRDYTPPKLGGATKGPLLKQLSDAANGAADLTKTIAKRLQTVKSRLGSKDSDPSWESDRLKQTATGESSDIVDPSSRVCNAQTVQKSVLVVDDSRSNSLVLRRMLQEYPELQIDEASNAVEALDASIATPYNLILMDPLMGEMGGYECTRRLRQEGLSVPIVLTTANFEWAETFTSFGLDDLLIRPVTKRNLAAVLLKFEVIPTGHPSLPLPPEENSQSTPLHSVKPAHTTPAPLVNTHSQMESMIFSSASVEPPNFYPGWGTGSQGSALNRQRPRALAQFAPILIVDDDPISRRVLREHLRQVIPSREVVQASEGTEAVALCSAGQKFAIIYMDLAMPAMDGDVRYARKAVAAMRIRNMRAIGGGPPIIAVTGLTLDGESFQGLRASGINDAIAKPVCQESLIATLYSFGIFDSANWNPAPEIVRRSTDPGSFGDIAGQATCCTNQGFFKTVTSETADRACP